MYPPGNYGVYLGCCWEVARRASAWLLAITRRVSPGSAGALPAGKPERAEPTPRQVARRMESRPAAWDADRPHAMAAEPELRDSAGERQEVSAPRPRPRRSFCPALNDRGARIQEIVGTDPCRAPAPFRSRFRRARRHRVGNGMGPAGTPKRHTVSMAGARDGRAGVGAARRPRAPTPHQPLPRDLLSGALEDFRRSEDRVAVPAAVEPLLDHRERACSADGGISPRPRASLSRASNAGGSPGSPGSHPARRR